MSKYTIGIDLGGTTMTAGLVNENYEIVAKTTWATRLPRPAEDLEKALADLCRTVAKENKVDFADINYVGIGTPGSVNFKTGFVGFNTNFGYYDWNLGPDMEKMLGCKVYAHPCGCAVVQIYSLTFGSMIIIFLPEFISLPDIF